MEPRALAGLESSLLMTASPLSEMVPGLDCTGKLAVRTNTSNDEASHGYHKSYFMGFQWFRWGCLTIEMLRPALCLPC
jgi:hypothetical protein